MSGKMVTIHASFLMYMHRELGDKKRLWTEIVNLRNRVKKDRWCIVGDFNSIKYLEERRDNFNVVVGCRDMQEFNNFIHEMEVEGILLVGRGHTLGIELIHTQSRLDRILVSNG